MGIIWGSFGAHLGVSWVSFGGPLGDFLGSLDVLLAAVGCLGGPLGIPRVSWDLLGRLGCDFRDFPGTSGRPFGSIFEASGRDVGRFGEARGLLLQRLFALSILVEIQNQFNMIGYMSLHPSPATTPLDSTLSASTGTCLNPHGCGGLCVEASVTYVRSMFYFICFLACQSEGDWHEL